MSKLTIVLDSQALDTYQKCPRRYELGFIEHLTSLEVPNAIIKGLVMHKLLQIFYEYKIKGKDFKECSEAALNFLSIPSNEEEYSLWSKLDVDTQLLLIQRFAQYCAYYRSENITPRISEKGFSKVLYESDEFYFVYEGRIDLTLSDGTWVDFKTRSYNKNLFPERNQFFGYCWALGVTQGLVSYISMNKTGKPEELFQRELVNFRPDLIEDWVTFTTRTYMNIAISLFERNTYSGDQAFIKHRAACVDIYGICPYVKICGQTSLNVINFIKKTDFQVREWRPW